MPENEEHANEVKMYAEFMQEHTAQTMDRLKEKVEELKVGMWMGKDEDWNDALGQVINLIEEVSDK